MNNWNFTGHCAADAETRYSKSGDAIVSFSVAVKSGFGDKATTTWARCSMFGNRGTAVSEFLTKGQLVGVCLLCVLAQHCGVGHWKASVSEVRKAWNWTTSTRARCRSGSPAPRSTRARTWA